MSVVRSEVFKSCVSVEAHRVLHFHEYLHNNGHYVNKRFTVHCGQLHGLYHESQTQSVSSQWTFLRFNTQSYLNVGLNSKLHWLPLIAIPMEGMKKSSNRFFSPFCHQWSFGSLPLSPLACLVGDTSFPAISSTWLNRNYLNWTELDDDITEFNNEMPLTENWVFNLVILHYWHTIFLFWYCKVALTQSVLLKALYK